MIPETAIAPEMPATRDFLQQLVAYITAFLPSVPTSQYFISNEGLISAGFPVYTTRKTQGWFRGWGRPRPSDAAASPGPGAAPGGAGSGAGAATPARPPAPAASADEDASGLIAGGACDDQATSPTVNLEILPPAGRAY